MRKQVLLLPLIIFFSLAFRAFAQQPEEFKDRILMRNQMVEDYSILYSSLLEFHPNPFAYSTEQEFQKHFQAQMNAFPDSLNMLQFLVIARKLNEKLKCGHSFGIPSPEWYESLKGKKVLLPFEIGRQDEKIIVRNVTEDASGIEINDEILAVGGVSIGELLKKMGEMQERDGLTNSYVDEVVIRRFRTYYFFMFGNPAEIRVDFRRGNSNTQSILVYLSNRKMNAEPKKELPAHFKLLEETHWSKFAIDTISGIAYLKISSFSDRKDNKKYYRNVFTLLQKLDCQDLVIDIRDNGGGYFVHGNRFLSYLSPEKFEFNFQRPKQKPKKSDYISMGTFSKLTRFAFNLKPQKFRIEGQRTHTFSYKPNPLRFKNKVHLITNGITFSTSSLVAAQLKRYGTVCYGTETGGAESGTNALLINKLILPNSQIHFNIPYYHVLSNSQNMNSGMGVKPNFEISAGEGDSLLYQVLDIIREDKE